MLYTQADKQKLKGQLIRRICATAAIFLIPFAAGFVIMNTIRVQWLSAALSIVGMVGAVFYYGMCLSPYLSYNKFLRDVLNGLNHEFLGRLLREEGESLRDGVPCRTLYFIDSEKDGEERLCYLDKEKSYSFREGIEYGITVHGQAIIAIEEK